MPFILRLLPSYKSHRFLGSFSSYSYVCSMMIINIISCMELGGMGWVSSRKEFICQYQIEWSDSKAKQSRWHPQNQRHQRKVNTVLWLKIIIIQQPPTNKHSRAIQCSSVRPSIYLFVCRCFKDICYYS